MAELVHLTNLKGPRGNIGPQGLPGVNATPADTAVAGWLSTSGTSATQVAADTRYGSTMYAPAHGVVGDGVTDDAPALAALLTKAATFGAVVSLDGKSTILLGSTIMPPDGTRLIGNWANVKKKSTLAGIAFHLDGKDRVHIQGLHIDGQKAAFTSSEHHHGIYIVNGSENVTIRDVTVHDCNGDGIYVGDQAAASKNITIENVFSYGNNRQGLSVTHVSGLSVSNSMFSATTGTNPRAGVDIEPNSDAIVCENITFTACRFSGNGHFGFVVAFRAAPSVHHGGISLIGCHIYGNGADSVSFGGGLNLRAARNFQMIGGSIHHNVGPGVRIDWTTISTGVKLLGVDIYENTQHGVQVTSGFDDLTVSSCTIRGNGTGSANTYPGVLLAPTIASQSFNFLGNVAGGASQRYGVQTVVTSAAITGATFVGNKYPSNGTGPRSLADDTATRLDLDQVAKVAITGSRAGNVALTGLLAHMASRGLITDSTTA